MENNNVKKSKKKYVIIVGIIITVLMFGIGAATQEGDRVDDVYYGGFWVGIVIIIVGCCFKSQKKIDREIEELANVEFDTTKNIDNYLFLDENRNKICIPKGIMNKKIDPSKIYDFKDILNYELLEDGNSISKGGVGRAIVGGALLGGVGAIVGGATGHKQKQTCTKLQIKLTINSMNNPTAYINFISMETRKDNFAYKNAYNSAQKVLSTLDIICNPNSKTNSENIDPIPVNKSVPEQIKEYKELLDSGAITEEEYEAKKKQILNL